MNDTGSSSLGQSRPNLGQTMCERGDGTINWGTGLSLV